MTCVYTCICCTKLNALMVTTTSTTATAGVCALSPFFPVIEKAGRVSRFRRLSLRRQKTRLVVASFERSSSISDQVGDRAIMQSNERSSDLASERASNGAIDFLITRLCEPSSGQADRQMNQASDRSTSDRAIEPLTKTSRDQSSEYGSL